MKIFYGKQNNTIINVLREDLIDSKQTFWNIYIIQSHN